MLFYVLLLVMGASSLCSSSSAGGGLSVSPIKHLEASVAASSARGSVAAIRCKQDNQECVVVVSLKPFTLGNNFKPTQPTVHEEQMEKMFGIKTRALSSSQIPASFCIQLGSSCTGTMTGFAADIQHLMGVAMEKVESHRSLYSESMSVDRVVRAIASTVQRAARSQGGRPYGIQALFVGLDSQGKLQLYTIDPTGGWQHYGAGATAVGRGAKEVRALLYKQIKNGTLMKDSDGNVSNALRMAISSLVGESIKESDNKENFANDHKLEALLVLKSSRNDCSMRRIDDSEVYSCLKQISEKE